ncbi:MAG: tRNA uridine(34) 5-carboxymethylaminomethyl modification radical SAM/GNAT enzyme Elp3 [Anaerolineales bacterium]|nr:tRNA uridine(34) 5-carboxymethylaminomethyl modification radical SAM/GNAT enzyme Elp3 [Anaerolineales bacterium]
MAKRENWSELRSLPPEKLAQARLALEDIRRGKPVEVALRTHLWRGAPLHKSALVAAYNELVRNGEWEADEDLLARIRLKPVRTLSGVTTVTVLTKPYPCPGKCIFCPDDVRMPKSYLPDEPGAARALENEFDPYRQVTSRLEALTSVGHPTDKIELLILGGTFSAYRRDYQAWFILRCFQAMNESHDDTFREDRHRDLPSLLEALAHEQQINETAPHRNVGLVSETRPDEITPAELAWLRTLGVTKVQLGAQSLDDRILELNRRGHTVADLHRAVALLRAGGFKIVLHWMPNLLGATLDSDHLDFARLWDGLCPDEIKIYPTQLLANAPLYEVWQRGEYRPYTTEELIHLIADIKPTIPRYCRVNRVIRDIPSTHVVEGNKRTSLRQDVHAELARRGTRCHCIRCREVRDEPVNPATLQLDDLVYHPDGAEEHFLSFVTPNDKIAGFLRLSLPKPDSPETGLKDLQGAAIIREVHVYGQSLEVGRERPGAAQHAGLGTRLLAEAERIAREKGYRRMAVIAAVGTRQYYLERGFERGELYLVKTL